MKSKLLLAAIVLSLAACSQPASDNGAAPVAPVAAVAGKPAKGEKVNCPPSASAYQVLPRGVKLDTDYHIRADRVYALKNGRLRRKVTLEILSGDAASTLAALETAMAKAGYVGEPRKTDADGRVSIAYSKKGIGLVRVSTSPEIGDKPSNPGAKGLLMIDTAFKAPAATPAPAAT